MKAQDSEVKAESKIDGEDYFTCERFRCTMKKAVCLNRQHSQVQTGGGWAFRHLECVNCEQGKKIISQNTEYRRQNTEGDTKIDHENTKEMKHETEGKKMEEMKRCNKCLVEKPLEQFNKNKQCKDGREGQCKSCKSEYAKKEWRKKQEAGKLKAESSKTEGKIEEKRRKAPRQPQIEITTAGGEVLLLSRTLDILVAAGVVAREKIEKAMEIAKWK